MPAIASGLLTVCANPGCASGWLRLWRGRHSPVFEGGWLCGPRCTRAMVRAAVARELEGQDPEPAPHRHRVPLGLLLLSHGAITPAQLRAALARQRISGGRLGSWLEGEHGVEERAITRALGVQWGCPVLSVENHSPERVAALVPRLFLDAFGFVPLRLAGSTLLYVGFEDRIDRCVGLAIERMTGLKVEAEGVDALAAAFSSIVEEVRPVEARLVRMRDYLWLRLWRRFEGDASRAVGFAGFPAGPVEDILGWLADSGT